MKFCYYVLWNETKDVTGPMPFKEALKFKEGQEWIQPMSILKLVIDEDGKEVKSWLFAKQNTTTYLTC